MSEKWSIPEPVPCVEFHTGLDMVQVGVPPKKDQICHVDKKTVHKVL